MYLWETVHCCSKLQWAWIHSYSSTWFAEFHIEFRRQIVYIYTWPCLCTCFLRSCFCFRRHNMLHWNSYICIARNAHSAAGTMSVWTQEQSYDVCCCRQQGQNWAGAAGESKCKLWTGANGERNCSNAFRTEYVKCPHFDMDFCIRPCIYFGSNSWR